MEHPGTFRNIPEHRIIMIIMRKKCVKLNLSLLTRPFGALRLVKWHYVPVKSKLKHPPPPGIPRAFDVCSCLGRKEGIWLTQSSQRRAFDHYSLGVGNLIASLDFMLRVALIPRGVINHGEDKPSCIQSERYPIRGGLAEKQRLGQALFCIWRYSRTIYIIFGM